MKNTLKFRLSFLAATTLCGFYLAHGAYGQPTALPVAVVKPQNAEAEQWQKIQIRNVPPRLMAWWLDSSHNLALPSYERHKPTWAIGHSTDEIATMLSLPVGVKAVSSIDAENTLWVLGTEDGIKKITEKIALLDKPLRQIEVRALCVQISESDAKTLGIGGIKSSNGISVNVVDAGVQEQVQELVKQNKAKILTAPRVTGIAGSKASISSRAGRAVTMGVKGDNAKYRELYDGRPLQIGNTASIISVSLGLSVTPDLNTDGSITLKMGPIRSVDFNPSVAINTGQESIVLKDMDGVPTEPITLKDGQAAVLQGFSWRLAENSAYFFDENKQPPVNVLVLVTALKVAWHE